MRWFVPLMIALCVALPSPVRATRFTRIIVWNFTTHCMSVGVQQQGRHPNKHYGPFSPRVEFDRVFTVAGDVDVTYYIEALLDDCDTKRPIYVDLHIAERRNGSGYISLQVLPKGTGYELKPFP